MAFETKPDRRVKVKKKEISHLRSLKGIGRDDWIRTSDLTHPKRARYQAAPRPVTGLSIRAKNELSNRVVSGLESLVVRFKN